MTDIFAALRKKNLVYLLVVITFIWSIAPLPAVSQTPEETGLQIATQARESQRGFGKLTATQTMILRNKQGQESKRQLRIKVLEVANDGDKVLFVFDEPRDVKGTAFLTHGHKQEADDQWLYLPALKRVKRISSSNRSGSFVGSEFAYEDMTPQEVEKFTYKYLRDEPCGELNCTVIEAFPTDKKSGYRRQLIWHDKEAFRVWKIHYFDRKDAHLKTLILDDYNQHLGQYWRANSLMMENHRSGKSTTMIWSNYQFDADIDENEFTKTGLKRVH